MSRTQLSVVLVPSHGREGTCPTCPTCLPIAGHPWYPLSNALISTAFSPRPDVLAPEFPSLIREPDIGLGSASIKCSLGLS